MFIDSHAHLDSLEDLTDVLERSREARIEKIVAISSNLDSSVKTAEIARGEEMIYAAVGVHPHNADTASSDVFKEIENLINEPKVVALGETGLDYHYMNSDKESQINSLNAHIELGKKHELPIVIHVREADDDLIAILREQDISPRTGVIHCFTGNYETAKKYLDLGFYISFSGIVTFKKSDENRGAARNIPLDRMLIETDSPYLAPVPHRGKKNEPAYVRHVAETIAEVRDLTLEEIAEITSANTEKLFNLSG